MKKNISQIIGMKLSHVVLIGVITVATILIANTSLQAQALWTAPVTANKVANPIPSNDKSIAAGKAVYTKICYDCHGKKGKGDGPKSGDLDKSPQNFTAEKFQLQTDGALFWKITEGRKPMPTFKKDLTEDQRWQVIHYLRVLGKKD